jgi:hypothetical protein
MVTLERRNLCPVCGYNLGFQAWNDVLLQTKYVPLVASNLDMMMSQVAIQKKEIIFT